MPLRIRYGHTDSSRLDHVPDCESLDRLVLRCASRAVGASDRLDVATTLLVTSAADSLARCHFRAAHAVDVVLGRPLLDHFREFVVYSASLSGLLLLTSIV